MISKGECAAFNVQGVEVNDHSPEQEIGWMDVSFNVVLDKLEQSKAIQDFKESMECWFTDEIKNSTKKEASSEDLQGISLNDFGRQEDSKEVLECLSDYNYHSSPFISVKHQKTGSIVAIMKYEKLVTRQPLGIELLVTHPGTSGVGGLCLERALADSRNRRQGVDKIVLLTWKASQTVLKYESLGFKKPANTSPHSKMIKMTLDPAESGRWVLVDGNWKIQCS